MVTLQATVLALAVTGAGETVLYDFSAPWCGPCRQMDPVVERLRQMGHAIEKVNIDQDRAKAAQFGVTNIPCFIMVVDGREVDRVVGATSQARLEQMLAKVPRLNQRGNTTRPTAVAWNVQQTVVPADLPRTGPTPGATAGLPSSAFAAETAKSPTEPSGDLIAASVRLKVQDPDGYSFGSGTIIDARADEALILTCGHIFRDSRGEGRITVDMFAPGAPRGLEGTLIRYDLKRDLGLVSIRPGTSVTAASLAPEGYRPRAGQRVASVGCDNGREPTVHASRINSVDRYAGPSSIQVQGVPADGRSGGGLFNDDGQLIGVCYAGDPADNEGLYAAIRSIRAELAAAGLTDLLESAKPGQISSNALVAVDAVQTAGHADVTSTHDPRGATAGLSSSAVRSMGATRGDSRAMPRPTSGRFTRQEAATLAEISGGRDSAEVICIVRSTDRLHAKSDVFVLDRPSAAFLDQLSTERRRQDGRQFTSFRWREDSSAAGRTEPPNDARHQATSPRHGFQPNWLPAPR